MTAFAGFFMRGWKFAHLSDDRAAFNRAAAIVFVDSSRRTLVAGARGRTQAVSRVFCEEPAKLKPDRGFRSPVLIR